MPYRICSWSISCLLLLLQAPCSGQTAAEWDSRQVNAIAEKLRCPCGCEQTMACQMPPHPCPTCKQHRIKIYNLLTSGQSERAILDQYIAESGPGILWVTPGHTGKTAPYAMLALGFVVVIQTIRRQLRAARKMAETER